MRIVQIVNSLAAGGAEVFVSQLSVAQVKLGNDVTLITYQGAIDKKGKILEEYLVDNGVKVIHKKRGDKGYSRYLRPLLEIWSEISRVKPDLIHAHLQWSDIYIAVINLFSFNRYRIVRTVHNKRRTSQLPKYLDRLFYMYYHWNVACSDYVMNNYVDLKLRSKLISIPNGIDINLLKAKAVEKTKEEWRSLLNLPRDKTIFINIGSMYLSDNKISKKNQEMIIDSVKALKEKEDVLVVFLGDGPMRSGFEEKCNEYNITSSMRFEGNVSNPYEFILAADFCLMPSLDEGLPIALIEMVCSGKPAIVSNIEAFLPFKSESVLSLETFLPEELTSKLEMVLKEKDTYIALGEHNKNYYESLFNIDKVALKYLELYKV